MAEKVLDVADKETLDLINEKFGATSDTGGSSTEGSLMAKLNEMLEQLGISTTGSTVQEVLEELLNTPKIIKSIQYGTAVLNWAGGATTIKISSVNPQKCFVLLNGSAIVARNNADAATTYDPYIKSFISDEISIERSSYYPNQTFGANGNVSYQIIEYV